MPKTAPKAATKPAAKPVAAKSLAKGDHVFLVDGSSYIFRAYHALPPLNRKSDGLQVNAVLGFCNMLWKLLRDMPPDNRPTHLAIVFDKSEVTFRNKIYPDYKAHRPPAPDDLIPQFGLIREATEAFCVPAIELADWEADDDLDHAVGPGQPGDGVQIAATPLNGGQGASQQAVLIAAGHADPRRASVDPQPDTGPQPAASSEPGSRAGPA